MADESTHDFVVIGAGSAGSIVASRLSESGRHSVLVLEAGGWDRNPWIHIPLGVGKTIVDKTINWAFQTEPEPELAGRSLYWASGKVVGGSAALNGLVHVRGEARDYDGWRDAGCTGWGWADVLPYFKKSENDHRGNTPYHAQGGPVTVSRPLDRSVLCDAFIAAGTSYGMPRNDDFNCGVQRGVGLYDLTTKRGFRSNSAIGALHRAKHRPNLRVEVRAQVQRIVVENGRAAAVEFRTKAGTVARATATREIVVCAGAVNSPKLLMLSGIGPAEHL